MIVWAHIDANRHIEALPVGKRITGLSLISRLVRMAARQGWQGATIAVRDPERREALHEALRVQPPPPSFTVEYSDAAAHDTLACGRPHVSLDANSIYRADSLAQAARTLDSPSASGPQGANSDGRDQPAHVATPWVRLESAADAKRADSALITLTVKSIDQEGVVGFYTQRPLARPVVRLLLNTWVSPNMVTTVAMASGVAAALLAATGDSKWIVLAGFLYWLGAVIDCIDGGLARLRVQGSKLGEWLDTIADDLSTFGLLAGLGIGLVRSGYPEIWGIVGVGGGVLGALISAKLYLDMHRMKMTIDTAQYPWFFGTPAEGGQSGETIGSRLFYYLSFCFRRDAFVTAIGILLAFNQRRIAAVLLGLGVTIIVMMFLVHTVVMAVRGTKTGEKSSAGT